MGYDPTGHENWGWQERATLGMTAIIIGIAIILAAPTGGASLAAGALAVSSTTVVAVGGSIAITGAIVAGEAIVPELLKAAKSILFD